MHSRSTKSFTISNSLNLYAEKQMALQKGFPLLMQQVKALLVKNCKLAWRKRVSTFAQLVSPLFLIILFFAITKWTKTLKEEAVSDPEAISFFPILPCEDKLDIVLPCYDFIWSGNDSSRVTKIVGQIMANNPGGTIPPNKVKSFKTKEEVDEWLYSNPMHCPGALHFAEKSDGVISYGLQVNSTVSEKRGQFEDTMMKFQMPLHIAVEREIARFLIGDPNFFWMVNLMKFPHPAKYNSEEPLFYLTTAAHILLTIILLRSLSQIRSLVAEKQLKHRQAMTIMNLSDTAYWLSCLIWEATFGLLLTLITIGLGRMFQFHWFINNSFMVIFLVFYLFQLSMIGFTCMLSTFIREASSSPVVSLVIFIISYVSQFISLTVFGFPYYPSKAPAYKILWSLFPPNLFTKSFQILHVAAGQGGISWSKRSQCFELGSFLVDQTECELTMTHVFELHIALFFVWFVMAIYLDNVIPNSSGVCKPIFYFFVPGYWTGKGGKLQDGGILSCLLSIPKPEYKKSEDKDVVEEEMEIKFEEREMLIDANTAVQFRGLVKTYPGKLEIGCCKFHRKSHVHAVKGLWFTIPKNQVFCLLGPKGAGKTSIINCLTTGISPVTNGDALVYGHSIRSSAGMSKIRRFIGVCPQFNILWDALSGEEHLNLFANIKGIPPHLVKLAVQRALADVTLTDAAKGSASSYSAARKRRLSMAIALIGDPKLVIFDEPTTGMDPITRRYIWEIIGNAKNGRTIILATHSAEEADIVGDRVGIVANGLLHCIGTSTRLKSNYGSGLVAKMSFSETRSRDALKDFFKHHFNVLPKEETEYSVSFAFTPTNDRSLTRFVAELEDRQEEFAIANIWLGSTTLQDVFLKVIKKAALENADADDKMSTITLESGRKLRIPKGADNIGIPASASPESLRGLMIRVYWRQDSDGNLYITGHSPETPIPEAFDLELPPMLPNGDPPEGIVLDL